MSLAFSLGAIGLPPHRHAAAGRVCSTNNVARVLAVRARGRSRILMCAKNDDDVGIQQRASVTKEEIVLYAERCGFRVKNYAAGPVCKLDLFLGDELYAFVTGIIMPTGWLHIESYKAKPKSTLKTDILGDGLLSVTPGMLVFMYALAFGVEKGSKEVYGLAIDDEDKQHARLKRYLKKYGGKEVRKITESIHSIGDKLLYGGNGTIIKADIAQLMRRSRNMLDRSPQSLYTPIAKQ